MRKYFIAIVSVVAIITTAAFVQPPKKSLDTRYFRYGGDDIQIGSLTNAANWTEITIPFTGCGGDDLPCVVEVENLPNYDPGNSGAEDFAHYLDLKGDGDAQTYVMDDGFVAGKEE